MGHVERRKVALGTESGKKERSNQMSKSIQQWEYKVAIWKPGWSGTKLQSKLNEFGEDGWE